MTAEKKTYIVSYQRDEFCPFCTNLAIAESESDVKRRYEERFEGIKCLTIREAKDHEVEPLMKRGCPVVECEHAESAPAIAFDTTDEYEAQCEIMTDYGIDIAGDRVWEACKADMEAAWENEDELRALYKRESNPEYQRRIRKVNRQAKRTLETYGKALKALGVELTYKLTVFDETEHIHKVTACRRGYVVGCIASW